MGTTLTASLEDYLEAIFHIIDEKQAVRPKDIARRLAVSNASVTGALRALADKGMIHYAPYDVITLTDDGLRLARDVVQRHVALRDFFVKVFAVEYAAADEAACRMEHGVPPVILERFLEFVRFVETCPRAGGDWIAGFGRGCNRPLARERCASCVAAMQGAVAGEQHADGGRPADGLPRVTGPGGDRDEGR